MLSSGVIHSPESQPFGLRAGFGGPTPPESTPPLGATRPFAPCDAWVIRARLRGSKRQGDFAVFAEGAFRGEADRYALFRFLSGDEGRALLEGGDDSAGLLF